MAALRNLFLFIFFTAVTHGLPASNTVTNLPSMLAIGDEDELGHYSKKWNMTPVQMCTLMGHQMTIAQPLLDLNHPLVSHLPTIGEMAMSNAVMICEKVLEDARGEIVTVTEIVEETKQEYSVPRDFVFDEEFEDVTEDMREAMAFTELEMQEAVYQNEEELMELIEIMEEQYSGESQIEEPIEIYTPPTFGTNLQANVEPYIAASKEAHVNPYMAANVNPYMAANANPYMVANGNPYMTSSREVMTDPYAAANRQANINPYMVANGNPYMSSSRDTVINPYAAANRQANVDPYMMVNGNPYIASSREAMINPYAIANRQMDVDPYMGAGRVGNVSPYLAANKMANVNSYMAPGKAANAGQYIAASNFANVDPYMSAGKPANVDPYMAPSMVEVGPHITSSAEANVHLSVQPDLVPVVNQENSAETKEGENADVIVPASVEATEEEGLGASGEVKVEADEDSSVQDGNEDAPAEEVVDPEEEKEEEPEAPSPPPGPTIAELMHGVHNMNP